MLATPTTPLVSAGPPTADPFVTVDGGLVGMTPALRLFARRFLRSPDDADDLVQETLLKALRFSAHFKPGTSLKSWLFTIMRNSYYTNYKRRRREPVGEADCTSLRVSIDAPQEWALLAREMEEALQRLSAVNRQALVLVALGTSYEETAQLCGCEIGTVKSRVNRARRELMSALA